MANFNRRQWLSGVAGASVTAATGVSLKSSPAPTEKEETHTCALALKDFKPRSKLHVKESEVLTP